MSGWRSTKSGKHFRTGTKPGISSGSNNHSNNSGSQPSSVRPGIASFVDIGNSSGFQFIPNTAMNRIRAYVIDDWLQEGRYNSGCKRINSDEFERHATAEDKNNPNVKIVKGEYSNRAVIMDEDEYIEYNKDKINAEVNTYARKRGLM